MAKDSVEKANKKIGNVKLRVANNIPHEQMPVFVSSCDLIICTSDYEGWPNSIK